MKNSTRILQIAPAPPGLWAQFTDGPGQKAGERLPVALFALVEFEDETDPEFRWQEIRPYVFSATTPGDPDSIWDATESPGYRGWAPE
ncbi:MAG: hypothetical protein J0M19_12910 [Sphingomonadales bacterium]|nr:hypothetical protein [Sphingomonadales bacterium]